MLDAISNLFIKLVKVLVFCIGIFLSWAVLMNELSPIGSSSLSFSIVLGGLACLSFWLSYAFNPLPCPEPPPPLSFLEGYKSFKRGSK